MKYSEAKKILEKNGMKLDTESSTEEFFILCHNEAVTSCAEEKCYLIDSYWGNNYATVNQLAIAQKVAYKLSRTKPEDREDKPKKYYLMIPHLPDSLKNVYINKDLDVTGRFLLLDNKETPDCQTLFTDAEIKQMQQDPIFKHVDLEEWKIDALPF